MKMDGFQQVIAVERFMSMQGDGQDILKNQNSTYDQAEHFLRFIDKYVSHAVGNHYFQQWSKLNRSKNFLDKVTASEIAYTILVYENTKEVWEEEVQIKAMYKTDEERRNATHEKKPSNM
jgi:hypothetical protein